MTTTRKNTARTGNPQPGQDHKSGNPQPCEKLAQADCQSPRGRNDHPLEHEAASLQCPSIEETEKDNDDATDD
ncbi:MAG TPA: hypothetical protein DDW73_24140 [Rhizobium sp.]|nr:hypothetical protein [Rhizobium sp.]